MCPELTRDHIPKARDAGHFLSVTGTVIRTSVTKVLEYERDYMCNKCRHVFSVQAAFEQFYTFTPPTSCPNEEGCNSFKFTCLSGSDAPPAACKDYQEIKIQEQVRWCIFMYSHPGAKEIVQFGFLLPRWGLADDDYETPIVFHILCVLCIRHSSNGLGGMSKTETTYHGPET